MIQEDSIFNKYKPLRNHLNKLSFDDSFFVIWSYIQHLQFNKPIPKEIEVLLEFLNNNHIQKIRMCSEWELEILVREIIINGQENSFNNQTLKKWGYLAGAINKLRNLEDNIGSVYINKDNLLVELFRKSHCQFPWQTGPNSKFLTRYYKIFSTSELDQILQKSIGLTAKNLYLIGMMFVGAYLKHPAINLPIEIEVKGISQENIDKFLKVFSVPISELKEKIKNEQEFNDKFIYSFSSLRALPIIKMIHFGQERLVCPLPTLLFWRITSGVYYEICNEKSFDNYFGVSFQNYAGEVIGKVIATNEKINFQKEEQYFVGKDRKDSADWIIYDNDAVLFVECKTKRLRLPAKLELDDSFCVNEELEKMASFILQIYKTIKDYKDNKYSSFKFDKNKKVFPLILTLEEWYLFGNQFSDELDKILIEKLEQEKINPLCLEQMPYSICSIDEFENIIQIIQKTGISDFMQKKVFDNDKKKWAFQSFMNSTFTEYYKNTKFLFEEDYQSIFNSVLKNNNS